MAELQVGDKVVVRTHDYRTNNRMGVIKNIEHLLEKSEKPAFTKYHIEFIDEPNWRSMKAVIRNGDFAKEELKKVL